MVASLIERQINLYNEEQRAQTLLVQLASSVKTRNIQSMIEIFRELVPMWESTYIVQAVNMLQSAGLLPKENAWRDDVSGNSLIMQLKQLNPDPNDNNGVAVAIIQKRDFNKMMDFFHDESYAPHAKTKAIDACAEAGWKEPLEALKTDRAVKSMYQGMGPSLPHWALQGLLRIDNGSNRASTSQMESSMKQTKPVGIIPPLGKKITSGPGIKL